MTTLKNFQAEIEEIHVRERAKQHTQGARVLPSDGQLRQASASSVSQAGTTTYGRSDLHSSEQEEQILSLLAAHNDEQARNTLASLLTQFQGEYVFRIGQRPPLDPLFNGERLDSAPGWTGIGRTQEEVDILATELPRPRMISEAKYDSCHGSDTSPNLTPNA
ncbi:hypothetical protein JVT61DRAFT_13851 [Boletus reticuloceps]|uniref:Uncharacterized protein n=1 Tax=Boletus reticuloceps TaxID=495285 RepID=A0A8I2YTM7_9AGAM|nr:hypothetical protein JVT61DRAFT_13851 [Boletus reticuloceps]